MKDCWEPVLLNATHPLLLVWPWASGVGDGDRCPLERSKMTIRDGRQFGDLFYSCRFFGWLNPDCLWTSRLLPPRSVAISQQAVVLFSSISLVVILERSERSIYCLQRFYTLHLSHRLVDFAPPLCTWGIPGCRWKFTVEVHSPLARAVALLTVQSRVENSCCSALHPVECGVNECSTCELQSDV